jgi:hypothetical protein
MCSLFREENANLRSSNGRFVLRFERRGAEHF